MSLKKLLFFVVVAVAVCSSSARKARNRGRIDNVVKNNHNNQPVVRHVYNAAKPNYVINNKHRIGSDKHHILNLPNKFSESIENIEIHISDGNDKIITKDGKFIVHGKELGQNGFWLNKRKFTTYVPKWNGWWVGKIIFDEMDNVKGMKTMFVRTNRFTENPPNEVYMIQPDHDEQGYLLWKDGRDRRKNARTAQSIRNSQSGNVNGEEEGKGKGQCKDKENNNKPHGKNKHKHGKNKNNKKNKNKNKKHWFESFKDDDNDNNDNHHTVHKKCCNGFKGFVARVFIFVIIIMLICCVFSTCFNEIGLNLSRIDIKIDLENKEIKINWKDYKNKELKKERRERKRKERKEKKDKEKDKKVKKSKKDRKKYIKDCGENDVNFIEEELVNKKNENEEICVTKGEITDEDMMEICSDDEVITSTICTQGGTQVGTGTGRCDEDDEPVNTDDGVTCGEN